VRLHFVTAYEMWKAVRDLEQKRDPSLASRGGAVQRTA